MPHSIVARHLVENGPQIITQFGLAAYLGCFARVALARREVGFLELIMRLRAF